PSLLRHPARSRWVWSSTAPSICTGCSRGAHRGATRSQVSSRRRAVGGAGSPEAPEGVTDRAAEVLDRVPGGLEPVADGLRGVRGDIRDGAGDVRDAVADVPDAVPDRLAVGPDQLAQGHADGHQSGGGTDAGDDGGGRAEQRCREHQAAAHRGEASADLVEGGVAGEHLLRSQDDVQAGDQLAAELACFRQLRCGVVEPRGELAVVEDRLERVPLPELAREPELAHEMLRDAGVLLAELQPLPPPLGEFVLVVLPGIAQAALERVLPALPVGGEVVDELAEVREPLVDALTDVEDARDVF